jgi:hypothetical protein
MGKKIMALAFGKVVLAGTLLTGGITMGALTTYNGGSAISTAKAKITQQGVQLGIFKSQAAQMVAKIQTQKDRLAYLEANGTEKDQAEIASLKQQIADYEKNADLGGDQLAQRILDLQAEVDKANTDSADLQKTVDNTTTETAMLQSQLDVLTDNVPAGYAQLKMINGTPQIVYKADGTTKTELTIDKTTETVDTAHLTIINNDQSRSYTVVMADGTKTTIAPASTVDLGLVKTLDAKTITIIDAYQLEVGKYYLMAQ